MSQRTLIVTVGGVVGAALVAIGLWAVLGIGGDGEELPPPQPLALRLPRDLSDVFSVDGGRAALSRRDRQAVIATVEGYLRAAAIEGLQPPAEDDDDAKRPAPDLRPFFTEAASQRARGRDLRALSDAHLPVAEHGVSTDFAKLDLAALVEGETARLVAVHFDMKTRVRTGDLDGGDAVLVHRVGDLVLEPAGRGFRIGSYDVDVRRSIGTATTTTAAAFWMAPR